MTLGSKEHLRPHGINPDLTYVYVKRVSTLKALMDGLKTSLPDFRIEWEVAATSGTLAQYVKLDIDIVRLERNMGVTDGDGTMKESFWTFEGTFGSKEKVRVIGLAHANGDTLSDVWLQAPDTPDCLPLSTSTPYYYDEHRMR